MKSHEIRPSSPTQRRIVWVTLLVWVGLLALWAHHERSTNVEFSAWSLRNTAGVRAFAWNIIWGAGDSFARFLPVGVLSVLAFPDKASRVARILRRGLPALGVSLVLSTASHWYAKGALVVVPGIVDLFFAWAACVIGCWAAMIWAQGWLARALFLLELVMLVALLAMTSGALLYRAVEPTPLSLRAPSVTSAEKRRLYALFSGKNPLKLETGKVVDLILTAPDVNLLLAWGLSMGNSARSALVTLDGNEASLLATTPIPGCSRYLNVSARGRFDFTAGHLTARADQLRIGRIEFPRGLLTALSPIVARAISNDARIKPVFSLVHRAKLEGGVLTFTYGHGNLRKGFVSSLFREALAGQVDISSIKAQVLNLVAAADKLPTDSDERFGATVQTAFLFAREHSAQGQAVANNRAALLALGIVLGHPRVETLVGSPLDDPTREALSRSFTGTTLRRREDWPKHFFVSAALTIVVTDGASNASGLFKEEKDAAGGSGFSFRDLLADRAGTTFAEVATRDETTARRLQARLAQGYHVDDYFPQANDLPEDIQDAELLSRYGGVGGEEYHRLTAEIERRVANCAAYQESR
jgi:energy-converting hydrogenase Eha subunit E